MESTAHRSGSGIDPATLYVVATPIGNLADVTLRALDVLRGVDAIAAEDTRVSSRLLARYGIATRLMPVHEHNERQAAARIAELLRDGKSVALVSDAGTPGVSDPGARVVAAVRAAGLRVVPVPGPSAALAALSASGSAAGHVLFYGFLPATAGARRRELAALKHLPYATVFFEAPHRIAATLADLAAVFGPERPVTVARELTKLHEEIYACTLAEAGAWLTARSERVRGEFVLVVEGAPGALGTDAGEVERVLKALLDELPVSRAAAVAARITGASRNDVYRLALALRGEG